MRKHIPFIGLLLLASASAASADPAPWEPLSSAGEIVAALSGTDQVARLRAESCGLQSSDRAVRGYVIRHLLAGAQTISIAIASQDDDKDAEAFLRNMPSFMATDLVWSDDGVKFKGNSGVGGQLIGDSLAMTFPFSNVLDDKGKNLSTSCEVSLRLSQQRDGLDGTLRCQGVPYRFRASLGF